MDRDYRAELDALDGQEEAATEHREAAASQEEAVSGVTPEARSLDLSGAFEKGVAEIRAHQQRATHIATSQASVADLQSRIPQLEETLSKQQAVLDANPELPEMNPTYANMRLGYQKGRDDAARDLDAARAQLIASQAAQRAALVNAPFASFGRGLEDYVMGRAAEFAGAARLYSELAGFQLGADYAKEAVDLIHKDMAEQPAIPGGVSSWIGKQAGHLTGLGLDLTTTVAATGATGLAGSFIASSQGAMRNALEDEGVTDHKTVQVASHTVGTLIGGINMVVPIYALKGMSAQAEHAFQGTIAQVSAKVVTGAVKVDVANVMASALSTWAQIFGVKAASGKPIDWSDVMTKTAETVGQASIDGLFFGAHHEVNMARGGAYRVRSQSAMAAATERGKGLLTPGTKESAPKAEPAADVSREASATPLEDSEAPAWQSQVAEALKEKPDPQQQELRSLIDHGHPLREIPLEMGLSPDEARPLLEQAVADGVLRKDAEGNYRRVAQIPEALIETPAAPREEAPTLSHDLIFKAIEDALPKLPRGVTVKSFADLAELPEAQRREAKAAQDAGNVIDALTVPKTGDIYLSRYAIDPAARMNHEVVHSLVEHKLLDEKELRILADRAAKIPDLYDREAYRKAYEGRENAAHQLLQEEAAHLYEMRVRQGVDFGKKVNAILDRIKDFIEKVRNGLQGHGFKSAEDVMRAIDRGDVARREQVQKAMRAEDINAAAVKKDGTLFAFAGERAKTADHAALAEAKKMEGEGKDRADIWTKTGWFRGRDQKWRFEIDDSGAMANPGMGTFRDVLYHPRLWRSYPQLGGFPAAFETRPVNAAGEISSGGVLVVGRDEAALRSVGLHEGQHGAQHLEDFAKGGDAKSITPDEIAAERARLSSIPDDGLTISTFSGDTPDSQIARNLYHRLAGEVEARTVQKRMDMTAEERRARPPWLDYDVPEDQQIVRGVQNEEVKSLPGYHFQEGTLFSIRSDTETGRSMRDDMDKLGFYSGALRAARGLKQAKGTPEQMLVMLGKEGAKKAEIEATGLDKWLAEKAKASDRSLTPDPQGRSDGVRHLAEIAGGKLAYEPRYFKPKFDNLIDMSAAIAWEIEHVLKDNGVNAEVSGASAQSPSMYLSIHGKEGAFKLRVSDHADRHGSDHTVRFDDAAREVYSNIETAERITKPDFDDLSSSEKENYSWVGHRIDKEDFISAVRDGVGAAIDFVSKDAPQKSLPVIVTKDEIVDYLTKNRVGLNAVQRSRDVPDASLESDAREQLAREFVPDDAIVDIVRNMPNDTPRQVTVNGRIGKITYSLESDRDQGNVWINGTLHIDGHDIGIGGGWIERDGRITPYVGNEMGDVGALDAWLDKTLPAAVRGTEYDDIKDAAMDAIQSAMTRRLETMDGYDRAVDAARAEFIDGKLDDRIAELREQNPDPTKWSSYSLDPSNPTYMETVLHLPGGGNDFQSGHFPEANITGHMMTSMTSHEGKPVYTIDQIQSDWGQKLRYGGVRDEAKIAKLREDLESATNSYYNSKEVTDATARGKELLKKYGTYEGEPISSSQDGLAEQLRMLVFRRKDLEKHHKSIFGNVDNAAIESVIDEAARLSKIVGISGAATPGGTSAEMRRLSAELRTAEAATPGHPLVNTTDQWVNTTLRRAIRQAAEADAEYIAIPHGDTVLSYNPGDEHGMQGFYGTRTSEGIVPKNLRKLLTKLDKDSPAPQKIDTLDSPSGKTGLGKGFTLFHLTDKVKDAVKTEGQALFAMRDDRPVTQAKDTKQKLIEEAAKVARAKQLRQDYDRTAYTQAQKAAADAARALVDKVGPDEAQRLMMDHSVTFGRETGIAAVMSSIQRVTDDLGIASPITNTGLFVRPDIRRQIISIANEGADRLLDLYGPDLTRRLDVHQDELAGYAPKDSTDPVSEGFRNFFRDFVAWPKDAKARAPNTYASFGDWIDAQAPQLQHALDNLQEHSRIVDQFGSNTPPIPTVGGGNNPPPRIPLASVMPSGGGPGGIGKRMMDLADRFHLGDVIADLHLKVSPMAALTATVESRAVAKDFAGTLRRVRYEWNRVDQDLQGRFSIGQLEKMWIAADEESVARQQGKSTRGLGLDRLTTDERTAVEMLQKWASETWASAKEVGIIDEDRGELPSYVPRMMIRGAARGDGPPRSLNRMGSNLRSDTPQTKARKYLTADETEAAAKFVLGDDAELARNIRTLPLAISKLQEAIAGRSLVNKIREIGEQSMDRTVSEGSLPNDPGWFTIDHPALKKLTFRQDEEGNPVSEITPIYIRGDFEGPLKAVLQHDSGALYKGLMELKGKAMGYIMFSPLMHNAVIYGRAFPLMPGKMLTFRAYFEGNKLKNDLATMREAIDAGLVPIGQYAGRQDITSMMEAPYMKPGNSIEAQAMGKIGDMFGKGDAVRSGVDKAGDFWHNTLLWDRVGDLQMGIYASVKQHAMDKGLDAQSAARVAAHFANRYGGAVPIEAMSAMARKTMNLTLFSRSYTTASLGAAKDMLMGLPKDVQAQIMRDAGPEGLDLAQSLTRRKSIAGVMLDVALFYGMLSIGQDIMKRLMGQQWDEIGRSYLDRMNGLMHRIYENPWEVLHPIKNFESLRSTADNEPGKEDRILIGYQKDGTAIYVRNPLGKTAEEWINYIAKPFDMLLRKESTIVRPIVQGITNDKGFGRHVYNPYPETMADDIRNVGRFVYSFFEAQIPVDVVKSAKDVVAGTDTTGMSKYKIIGPLVGLMFSKGAPHGPAFGELYRENDKFKWRLAEEMPNIREAIKLGHPEAAREMMRQIGVPPGYAQWIVRQNRDQPMSPSAKKKREFLRRATPEERSRFFNQMRMREASEQ